MLPRLLRTPRADLEVGVAIASGCMVPLSIAAAVLVGAGVFPGMRLTSQPGPDHVVVRVVNSHLGGVERERSPLNYGLLVDVANVIWSLACDTVMVYWLRGAVARLWARHDARSVRHGLTSGSRRLAANSKLEGQARAAQPTR